jgi:hypothetical protein
MNWGVTQNILTGFKIARLAGEMQRQLRLESATPGMITLE